MAATTGWVVRQDTNRPIAAKLPVSSKRPSKLVATSPKSSLPPNSSDSPISVIRAPTIARKASVARNLPSTICVIDIGADMSMAMVWLRRSSATSRMVSNGTDISSTIEAMPNIGTATISVSPGALGMRASCA